MNGVRSLSPPQTRSPMWVMLKIFIYNLLWLAQYQYKGVVKFNLNDLFFLGSVSEIMTTVELEKFTFNLNCGHQNN